MAKTPGKLANFLRVEFKLLEIEMYSLNGKMIVQPP